MAESKARRKAPRTAWGPGNPPPLSPGRPKRDYVAEEKARDPGISDELAAIRASLAFVGLKQKPKQGLVRFYVHFQARNAREFQACRERMEREWSEKKALSGVEAGKGSGGGVEGRLVSESAVLSDAGSDRAEELLEEFLKRHYAAAVEKAGGA